MKKAFAKALIVAALCVPFAGCPKDEPPPPPPAPKKEEPPPPPPKLVVPDYNPIGDDAAVRKDAARDITVDNAVAKAKDAEDAIDKATADLEAQKAAATEKKAKKH